MGHINAIHRYIPLHNIEQTNGVGERQMYDYGTEKRPSDPERSHDVYDRYVYSYYVSYIIIMRFLA